MNNIDNNTINNIKKMVDNGNLSEAMSQISPEMIQNFSKMFNNMQSNNSNNSNDSNNSNTSNNSYYSENSNNQNSYGGTQANFDFSNIDMNTIMKISSVMGKMNNSKDDPRANLLNSLRPYLRDSKKDKLDNYINLLNVSKIAEIMKDTNKEHDIND